MKLKIERHLERYPSRAQQIRACKTFNELSREMAILSLAMGEFSDLLDEIEGVSK